MTTFRVHTLGDSTIDNIYWLLNGRGTNKEEAKGQSAEGQLEMQLGPSYQIISHAYDGFTTKSLLEGGTVGSVLPGQGNRFRVYLKEKLPQGNEKRVVQPLQELEEDVRQNGEAVHYVVISVGGNDFRENLLDPIGLLKDVPAVQERYLAIAKRVVALGSNVRPVLMFQYRTAASNDPYHIYKILGAIGLLAMFIQGVCLSILAFQGLKLTTGRVSIFARSVFMAIAATILILSAFIVPLKVAKGILLGKNPGIVTIGALMEKFYRPILAYAQEARIPILDLPNSFNPREDLYISGIEPNAIASQRIGLALAEIIRRHDFTGPSKIYLDNFTHTDIPSHWVVT